MYLFFKTPCTRVRRVTRDIKGPFRKAPLIGPLTIRSFRIYTGAASAFTEAREGTVGLMITRKGEKEQKILNMGFIGMETVGWFPTPEQYLYLIEGDTATLNIETVDPYVIEGYFDVVDYPL